VSSSNFVPSSDFLNAQSKTVHYSSKSIRNDKGSEGWYVELLE